ncbi:MAG: beta-galactosidase, partial [Bacteroidia bacterium]|nr:beta-galactosidase [Bacteroidia bacterium]
MKSPWYLILIPCALILVSGCTSRFNKYEGVAFPEKLPHDWENPAVTNINREPPRASYISYGTENAAIAGNREMLGYGIPIYLDEGYAFKSNPPFVPKDDNPVGSYRREFHIPPLWKDREVFLHFGAVTSAYYVWVNGERVGYSEDSKTPSDFNITRFIRNGKNSLAVEVYRWSDGSYLECQDFWRMSGITRDVYLFSTNRVHISDVFV